MKGRRALTVYVVGLVLWTLGMFVGACRTPTTPSHVAVHGHRIPDQVR